VALFLGRIDDPLETGRDAESAFRTILFTDLEGSTATVQRIGDEGAMAMLRVHDAIVRRALTEHRGLEVKHTGDGIMASFGSVRDALAAAVQMQRDFAGHNAEHPDASLAVRIGMSAGEPVTEHGDLFGAAVQLAARLCAHAAPGTIVISSVVADLAIGKQFVFGPPRTATLRGFPAPVTVCEVDWAG
jgi:class 3 adenylate cyclase